MVFVSQLLAVRRRFVVQGGAELPSEAQGFGRHRGLDLFGGGYRTLTAATRVGGDRDA
jgi:hypothetical protein